MDTPDKETTLENIKGDERHWSILAELAKTPEPLRQRILRPHAEAGFDAERDGSLIDQRHRLDEALGTLTIAEVAFQIGVLTTGDVFVKEIPVAIDDLKTLFRDSEAFSRYCNAYLYFGIRFLAGRIAPPEWMDNDVVRTRVRRQINDRSFALVVPPGPPAAAVSGQILARLLGQQRIDTDEIAQGNHRLVALNFLDDFSIADSDRSESEQSRETEQLSESERFELWLRGLHSEMDERNREYFWILRKGLTDWALDRSHLYLELEPATVPDRPLGGWQVTHPAIARIGLADVYWIARLLRADVSASAAVTYSRSSWLHLLRFRATLEGDIDLARELSKAEEVLRSVFDFVCDLVQNAAELTDDREREAFEPQPLTRTPEHTAQWRETFDEELAEIELQRGRRRYRDPTLPDDWNPIPRGIVGGGNNRGDGWAERIKTGRQPRNLFGAALSGGGIRSATFNLGVLQALQEFDLLRQVDYLSTVSGGGFIGSWLVGNVRRTAHWLGRLTTWEESIAHLRRFSNYLAPRSGALTRDTWAMWATWVRNAFLIQLTGFTWLTTIMLVTLLAQKAFGRLSTIGVAIPLALVASLLVLATVAYTFAGRRQLSSRWVKALAVFPSWIVSFMVASYLWKIATTPLRTPQNSAADLISYGQILLHADRISYGQILLHAWQPWRFVLVFYVLAVFTITVAMQFRHRLHALWISVASVSVLYLAICGILLLFIHWSTDQDPFKWYAFAFGPSLVLAANTVSLVLAIGFAGRNSTEGGREWWTNFGALVALYGIGFIAIDIATIFGPRWLLSLLPPNDHVHIAWTAIGSWLATVIGGLYAGGSSKTSGEKTARNRSKALEVLAKAGGFAFIVGSLLLVATAVYAVLVLAGTNHSVRDTYWLTLGTIAWRTVATALGIALGCGMLFSWFFEINIFGLNQFYRSRLVRCYLGATRWAPGLRRPQPFTKFDDDDDMRLSRLTGDFRGPFPIFNCALNLAGSTDLTLHTRHSASFSLTSLRCGSARRGVGYAPTKYRDQEFAGGVMIGQAVAISGAAASPNMGYNTSPLVAFLLTMFNVRLGWWFPNPGRQAWDTPGLRYSLYYLVKELVGAADERTFYVNVSDGGHFENLGVYELVRRRCKVIIACDAECDESLHFGSLGNLVRLCETDFGAKIDIDVRSIRSQPTGFSLAHYSVGKITYSNGSLGYLIYIKASLTGDESVGIAQYRSTHPSFPHETTANQFFSEDQFESYRKLGQHIVQRLLRGTQPADHPVVIAERLADVLVPAGCTSDSFLRHTASLDGIWERFRRSAALHSFMNELMNPRPFAGPAANLAPTVPLSNQELAIGLELIQLMENVFLDLRLDDFWEHPDNRGWAMLFMQWARSATFRAIWSQTRQTFGIRFEYFCGFRLGLARDRPVAKV